MSVIILVIVSVTVSVIIFVIVVADRVAGRSLSGRSKSDWGGEWVSLIREWLCKTILGTGYFSFALNLLSMIHGEGGGAPPPSDEDAMSDDHHVV